MERSPEYSGTESCFYQYPQTVCRASSKSAEAALETAQVTVARLSPDSDFSNLGPVPTAAAPQLSKDYGHPGHNGPYNGYNGQYPGQYPGYYNGHPNCYTTWINRPGFMYVRYYNETTIRDINAKFVQGEKTFADYKGQATSTERIITQQGTCH